MRVDGWWLMIDVRCECSMRDDRWELIEDRWWLMVDESWWLVVNDRCEMWVWDVSVRWQIRDDGECEMEDGR